MLKLASYFFGEDYNRLLSSSVKARQKVLVIFTLLLLPVVIWTISTYSLATIVFHQSMLFGVLAASVAGLIIFILDLALVRMTTNSLRKYRLLLVVVSCLFGSLAIDAIFFKEDLHFAIERIQTNESKANFDLENGSLLAHVQQLRWQLEQKSSEVAAKYQTFVDEMDGTSGTRNSGYGQIAREKEAAWKQAQSELLSLQSTLSLEELNLRNKESETIQSSKSRGEGIILHMRALFDVLFPPVEENAIFMGRTLSLPACGLWLVVFLLTMLLEYMPVLVKSKWDETDYDKWKNHEEKVKKIKLDLSELEMNRLIKRAEQATELDDEVLKVIRKVG